MNRRNTYKTSIARAFFTTAAWVLNVGGIYIEWVCRHTFSLLKLLGREWWRSYAASRWTTIPLKNRSRNDNR